MITFLVGEAELELVPKELHGAPSVKRRARDRRRAPEHLLLDQAQDHKAMAALPDGDRRGRPDIAHLLTLLVQDSPLTRAGHAKLLIHTRHDELIRVRQDMRPPRAQATFYQLCEDLLRQGVVPLKEPLMTRIPERPLARVLKEEAKGPVVLLSEVGGPARTAAFAQLAREHADLTLVVGGFPKGTWRTPPHADKAMRVAGELLTAANALVPVLAGFEDARLAP